MSIYTTSGITVDDDPETEDLELVADQWSLLADVFASGEFCSGCVYSKRSWKVRRLQPEQECDCQMPELCPGVNPKAIANALRRQAS